MYPSWPAMTNLCVIAFRSSGSFRRTGCAAAAGAAIAALGDDARRVVSIEILREGLESAYRAVTGADAAPEDAEELAGVVAS